jgi:hypothetical protein
MRIGYAGTLTGVVQPGLELFSDLVCDPDADVAVGRPCELHLFTPERLFSRSSRRLVHRGWLAEHRLREALAELDLLYLPFSFDPGLTYLTERSFPSKLPVYLAAGRPVLVHAPASSTIAQFASTEGFAEIVTDPSRQALLAALARLGRDTRHRDRLAAAAHTTFRAHHDLDRQRAEFAEQLRILSRQACIEAGHTATRALREQGS